ncbi:hypothetical protein Tco_0526354 [Tanacetum coccineum]
MLWAWNIIWRKVVPALAPQGQARNLERVGPKERPLCMGPLASQAAQENQAMDLLGRVFDAVGYQGEKRENGFDFW